MKLWAQHFLTIDHYLASKEVVTLLVVIVFGFWNYVRICTHLGFDSEVFTHCRFWDFCMLAYG